MIFRFTLIKPAEFLERCYRTRINLVLVQLYHFAVSLADPSLKYASIIWNPKSLNGTGTIGKGQKSQPKWYFF